MDATPPPSVEHKKIDNSQYTNKWWSPGRGRLGIALWRGIGMPLFRLTPNEPYLESFWNDVKCSLLRCFGATIGEGVVIRSTCEVYYPWNLEIADHAWIGYGSNLYSLVRIKIGSNACVSQNAFLCTGSHDPTDPYMGLIVGDIVVGEGAWVAASSFIHPGVTIGAGAVIAAGSVVTEDMPPMTICGGVPCKPIRRRELRDILPGVGGGLKKNKTLSRPAEIAPNWRQQAG